MSALIEKYVNPLTDFGFKKLFEAAEIAKFSQEERDAYEESLKYYRDIKNVVDTSREEGRDERTIEIAIEMKKNNIDPELIEKTTGLSRKEIEEL